MKSVMIVEFTNEDMLEARALRFMHSLSDRHIEKYPNIYTYNNRTLGVISSEKLELPNEKVYDRSVMTPESQPANVNLNTYFALVLEEDEGTVELGRSTSRAGTIQSFTRIDFNGTAFWLVHTKPVDLPVSVPLLESVRLITQHRMVYLLNEDGSTKSLGGAPESSPIYARIYLIRPSSDISDILQWSLLRTTPHGTKIPVCYKRVRDCLIVYSGVAFDESWIQCKVSKSEPIKEALPFTAVYLADNGDYKRDDYQFSTIMDGRKGKRVTKYENTRQPYQMGSVDILMNPTARAEMLAYYLNAPLIGESISDFYARSENALSNKV